MSSLEEELPGNSFVSKQKQEKVSVDETETKKVTPIITGKAEKRNRSLRSRFKDHFATDGDSFMEHIVEKVIIPKSLELINTIIRQSADAFAQGVEEALFGKSTSRPPASPVRSTHINGRTPYNQMSRPATTAVYNQPIVRRRASHIVQDIVVEFREDGEHVIDTLRGIIERHGHATVGDYYGLVDWDEAIVSTDQEWGWTDAERFRSARTREVNGGFLIVLPRTEPISNGS